MPNRASTMLTLALILAVGLAVDRLKIDGIEPDSGPLSGILICSSHQ